LSEVMEMEMGGSGAWKGRRPRRRRRRKCWVCRGRGFIGTGL